MSYRLPTSRLLLLLTLAAIGFLLMWVPPLVIDQYERAGQLGNWAGTIYLIAIGLGAVLLVGSAGWVLFTLWRNTRQKRVRREQLAKNPSQLSAAEKKREVEQNLAEFKDLESDTAVDDEVRRELEPMVAKVEEKHHNQTLEIVAFGTISSGKSSLLNALAGRDVFATDLKGGTTAQRNEIPWPGADRVVLVDTPGLGEIDGADRQSTAAEAAKDADLVLLVVDGPLRESEFRLLAKLAEMEKRVLICLNKEDWFLESERQALLGQITNQVSDQVAPEDILALRSRPISRTRMRVMADGSEVCEQIDEPADISPLANRMLKVIKKDGHDLLLANLLLQSRGMVDEAKQKVEAALDRTAWQIVDKYTWGAGGVAALSPLPMVDLVAGIAVSSKMVLDLAKVYRQKMDAKAASELLGQLGKQLLGVLGVSAATPAVVSLVASTLKTVPGAGTIAGGALQGLVVALITRWIGAVFIAYFRNEMQTPPGGLAAIARREWDRLTSVDELRKFIQTARTQWASNKKTNE